MKRNVLIVRQRAARLVRRPVDPPTMHTPEADEGNS